MECVYIIETGWDYEGSNPVGVFDDMTIAIEYADNLDPHADYCKVKKVYINALALQPWEIKELEVVHEITYK